MAKMQDTDRHGNKRSSQWSSVATHNAATAKTAAANVGTEQAKYCGCHLFVLFYLFIFIL